MKRSLKARSCLKRHLLMILTLIGIVIGFAVGFGVRETKPSSDVLMWINIPGEVFLRLLKMMIIPIVLTNVITGTASLDPRASGMIGGVALAYIFGTTGASCLLGILLSVTIRPGKLVFNSTEATASGLKNNMETQDIFADMIRHLFPDNLITATFRKVVTQRLNESATEPLQRVAVFSQSSNLLGLIFACVVFGIATGVAKEKGKPFLLFFKSASAVVVIILQWFLWYSPIGICSLIAASVAAISDLQVIFRSLGIFVLTVSVGEVIIQLLILPALHFIAARNNPYILLLKNHRAWFVAFASTSTAVAMPEMIVCLNKYGVDKRVSLFVVPFSVTLAATGSTLYIVCSAIFLGDITGASPDAAQVLIIGILTAVSAMALPSVPSASLVSLVIIMTSAGLPTDKLGLLFTVEWFLDRMRSSANATGHTFCGAFTYYVCKKRIQACPEGVADRRSNNETIKQDTLIDCEEANTSVIIPLVEDTSSQSI